MRIPRVVAAVAAVSLALGGSLAVGFTAAAEPPSGWTIDSITSPLYPDGTLEFSGTRPSEDVVDYVTVTPFDSSEQPASCSGLNYGDTEFSCSFAPVGDFPVGDGTITFHQELSSSDVTFTVTDYLESSPPPEPEFATGPPAMSYDFIPSGVIAYGTPTAPATKVAIQFYYFTGDEGDLWESDGGCPPPGSDEGTFAGVTDNTCSVSGLTPGIHNIYSQQDIGDGETGVGEFASDYFVVPPTPTINYELYSDYSAELWGESDPSFELQFPDQCGYTYVYESGEWYCYTAPLAFGEQTFTVRSVDTGGHSDEGVTDATYLTGGLSAASTTETITVHTPTLDLEFAPGSITTTSTPQGFGTVVRTDLYNYDTEDYYGWLYWEADCGGPNPEEGEGYYWEGDRFDGIPSGQGTYGCTFDELSPGIWVVAAQQDDGDGDPAYAEASQFAVIPDAPEIVETYLNDDGSVTVDGDAPYGVIVHVVDAEGTELCEPVEADESWECTTEPLEPGDHSLRAYAVDDGWGEYESEEYYLDATYVLGGTSPHSEAVDVTIVSHLPDMSYGFVPGGVIIDGVPTGEATVVRTELWSWDTNFFYVDNCGGPHEDEGEGEGDYEFDGFNVFAGIEPGPTHCVFTGLAPGVWNPYSAQDIGDGETPEGSWVDDYFVVPATPTIATAVVSATGTVTFTGTTVPGNAVHVINGAVQLVCESAPANEAGTWTCTTPALPNGGYNFRAYSEDLGAGENEAVPESVYMQGGLSNLSAVKATTVAIAAPPGTGGTPADPAPTLITPSWFFSLSGVDLSNLKPGDTFTIHGSGLPAGAKISAELHSTPVSLGQATVGSNGTFALSATVPESTEPGDHTVVVTLTGDGLEPTTHSQPVTVAAAGENDGHGTEAGGAVDDGHGEAAATDGHGTDDSSATAPNILTNSMNPILEVLSDPGRIPAAFAAGLVLIIFAIVPAHLLNSTVAEQYERLTRRMPRLKTAPRWYTGITKAVAKAPVLGGILLMAATGFLFAFADPHFGPNLHSLRLIIALSGALFVVFFVANAITGAIMRRGWNVDVVVKLRPFGLVLTIAGVIVSRILEFSPGFLIGIVLGLSIATSAAAHHAWKAVLIRTSVIVTFGIISWIVYSSIADGVHHDPTFLNEVVLEFFVAIATEGIVLLLVELMPLHMLEGERLFKRSRVLWASVYLVVLTMFILAVVPWAGNWRELGESFWPWFTAVAIFGATCVAVYLFFRFIAPPEHHGDHVLDRDLEIELEEDDDERIALGNDR